MNKYFFEETNELHDEIISLHNFVLPTSTALWHFRKVISNEIEENQNVSTEYLSRKYNRAPGTRGSTNLKTAFTEDTWERQRERLAEISLIGIIALYEIWCDQICELFSQPLISIKLQYPTNTSCTNGVKFALDTMGLPESTIIKMSIYQRLITSKKYDLANLDNTLKCFRYFKELRNCLLHRGRKCEGKLYGAQSEFRPVATKELLGMKFVPDHSIYRLNDPVDITLHGVLGFTEVILRIITTIDAELSKTNIGEQVLLQRVTANNHAPLTRRKLPKLFQTLGWTGTNLTPELANFLEVNGVLSR